MIPHVCAMRGGQVIPQAEAILARHTRCYSFDRATYDRAAQKRQALGIGIGLALGMSQATGPAAFSGDFKSLLPGWSFLVQSDVGVTKTGSVVDTWTDQAAGIVGAAPTGPQKPITIAGPNGKPAIQSVNGQNTSVAFAFAMPAPGTTPSWIYAVFRQDAWVLNGALFGSPGAEFTMRVLQYATTPSISQAQTSSTVGGSALGVYGRMLTLFSNSATDTVRYGAGVSFAGVAAGNKGNSSLTLFNQLNSLPIQASLCLFGVRTSAPTAPQLAALDAAVTSYYGAGVEL